MYFSTLLVTLSGFGFTVSISTANTWDNMIDATQYYSEKENKIFQCHIVETVELATVNVCQTGAKTASIVVSVK